MIRVPTKQNGLKYLTNLATGITEFYTTRKIGETRHLQPNLTPTPLFKLSKVHNFYFRNINPSTIPRRTFSLLPDYTKECRRITTMAPTTKHRIITVSPTGSTNIKSLQTNTTKIIPTTLTSIAPRIGTSPIVSMSTMITVTIIVSQTATMAGTTTILGLSTVVNRSTSVKTVTKDFRNQPLLLLYVRILFQLTTYLCLKLVCTQTQLQRVTNKCLPQV